MVFVYVYVTIKVIQPLNERIFDHCTRYIFIVYLWLADDDKRI